MAGFQTVVATLRRSEQALAKQLENVRSAIASLTSGRPGRKAGRPAGTGKRGRPKGSGKKRGRPAGRKMSKAARKKMSDAAKKRWAAKKAENK